MERLRKALSRLPGGVLTCLTLAAILWLTLAPKPFGDESPQLFPGADKVAHALMFGGLDIMILLDYQRKTKWKEVSPGVIALSEIFCIALGIAIEYIQLNMHLGRGFEYLDMVADSIGVVIFALAWVWLQPSWSKVSSNKE